MWHPFTSASKTGTDHSETTPVCLPTAPKPLIQVKNFLLGLAGLCSLFASNCMANTAESVRRDGSALAQPEAEVRSTDAQDILAWVIDSGNNGSLPFIILDKKETRVYVFQADGRLRGAAPALIGSAVGDHSVPGIGERKLSAILPSERTTPAGRLVASIDRNLQGKEVLWVDYDAAISLHSVITNNTKERRAERLATPTPLDNRISYGCINVPAAFFKQVVHPMFAGTSGIVYVLPETRPVMAFFGAYAVDRPGH
jgi:hypothetical protein